MASQLLAQASHISAQTPHNCLLNDEALSWKLTEVWQIAAQSIINRKCSGSTCFPPMVRQ
jgi:hypothetical protein